MQKKQLQAYSGKISSELHPALAGSCIYRMDYEAANFMFALSGPVLPSLASRLCTI